MRSEHEGHRSRIRQSFLETGLAGMADHEALELLLTYAIPRIDVNPLSHRLLLTFGSLENVFKASPEELCRVEGIGPSTAAFLKAVFAVGQRILLQSFSDARGKTPLVNPEDACRVALALSLGDKYETLRLICLNKNLYMIHNAVISTGNLSQVPVEPRLILEQALLNKAYSIILCHNHPSGDLTPSPADKRSAAMMEEGAKALGILVTDQLILGHAAAYSFHTGRVLRFLGPSLCRSMTLEEYRESQWARESPLES